MRCVSGPWSAAKHELRDLGDGEKGARRPTPPPSRLVNAALPSNCSIFPNSCRPAETAVRRCPPLSSLLAPNLSLFSFLLCLLSSLLSLPPTCTFTPKQFSARSPGARSSPRPSRPNRNLAALSSAGFASRKPTQAEGDPWARLAFRHAFCPCTTRAHRTSPISIARTPASSPCAAKGPYIPASYLRPPLRTAISSCIQPLYGRSSRCTSLSPIAHLTSTPPRQPQLYLFPAASSPRPSVTQSSRQPS